MINWMYFPKNKILDTVSKQVLDVFEDIANIIDSNIYQYKSDEVLKIACSGLEAVGFSVEKSKRSVDLIAVPVLYGRNGQIEKSFEVDGYLSEVGYVLEVEAGRGVLNHQFLKDFFEACMMVDVEKLCIVVRNTYKESNDFEKVCKFFEAMYASGRLGIPLSGLLIIGY